MAQQEIEQLVNVGIVSIELLILLNGYYDILFQLQSKVKYCL